MLNPGMSGDTYYLGDSLCEILNSYYHILLYSPLPRGEVPLYPLGEGFLYQESAVGRVILLESVLHFHALFYIAFHHTYNNLSEPV